MNALSEALRGTRRVVFFGGAGVSVPSGIPDFRGENGLYAREYDGLTAEMLLSFSRRRASTAPVASSMV